MHECKALPHGHPFALAQASRSTDVQNAPNWSSTLGVFGTRGRPEASTAASHGRPTCASMVSAVGSSRRSTSAQGLTLVHFLAQRKHFVWYTLGTLNR